MLTWRWYGIFFSFWFTVDGWFVLFDIQLDFPKCDLWLIHFGSKISRPKLITFTFSTHAKFQTINLTTSYRINANKHSWCQTYVSKWKHNHTHHHLKWMKCWDASTSRTCQKHKDDANLLFIFFVKAQNKSAKLQTVFQREKLDLFECWGDR